MTKKKHTRVDVAELELIDTDVNFSPFPIGDSQEDDLLIGLQDSPDIAPPVQVALPDSKEPVAKVLSPMPEKLGSQTRPTRLAYPKDREIPGTPPTIHIEGLLPEHIRNGAEGDSLLSPLLYNTIDRWLTPPDLDSVGGHVGEEFELDDVNYILETNAFDKKNQLQPSIRSFSNDSVDSNMTWHELLSTMQLNGLDVIGKSDKFFATKKFSYQPPISPEKFVNYRYFYWVKNLGRWDVILNPASEFELILINGDLNGYDDLVTGDYIRVEGTEFYVININTVDNEIIIYDQSEQLFLPTFAEFNDVLIGHDKPSYNVQASGDYITNGWTQNNYWKHLDDLSVEELQGFRILSYPKAQIPIIELLLDVVIDDTLTYSKDIPPNVRLYPIQYIDQTKNTEPVNIQRTLVGYDPLTGDEVYEDRFGTIPIINKPVLQYRTGDNHLDGEPTTIDPILGVNAVKLRVDSRNYIFTNGLLDSEHDDSRQGRFYMYITQVSRDRIPEQTIFNQTTPLSEWVITHDSEYIPIIRVFLSSGEEITPLKIVSTELISTITFTSPIAGYVSLT